MLDFWRGIAACAVVVSHVNPSFSLGHHAVMLFFVVSGYCITAAGASGLRRDLPLHQFIYRRLRRIYPPFFFSLMYYAATRVIKIATGGENDLLKWTVTDWIQNLTLTQWFTLVSNPQPLPFLNPTNIIGVYWSLQYEEQFYLIVGLLLFIAHRWKIALSNLLLMMTGVGLVWFFLLGETCTGIFIDYWFMFGIGALVYARLCTFDTTIKRRIADGSLLVLFLFSASGLYTSLLQVSPDPDVLDRPRDVELAVCSGFALTLILLRPLDTRFSKLRIWPVFHWLGLISYSLYLTHYITLAFIDKAVAAVPFEMPQWLGEMIQVAIHLGAASVFWYFCERPFLNKSLPSLQTDPVTEPNLTNVGLQR
jgi:peptidoglycan/LPS O-acetylase OafA/YrhL